MAEWRDENVFCHRLSQAEAVPLQCRFRSLSGRRVECCCRNNFKN